MTQATVQSLERGLAVLLLFTDERCPSIRIDDVMAVLGVPRSTAYRLVGVLKRRGFLQQGAERGTLQLGPQIASLGRRASLDFDLGVYAQPFLRRLAMQTRETALVAVLAGNRAICTECVESEEMVRLVVEKGMSGPLHACSAGKAILAGMPPRERERFLIGPLIGDIDELRAELDQIRHDGFAMSVGEPDPDSLSVSVPVWSVERQLLGTLCLAGPAFRLTRERARDQVAPLQQTARAIAASLAEAQGLTIPARWSRALVETAETA
ncbi:IclR family transcriptional regulator [Marinivivus vitaminiproducens]|uniref:IclR family transcriptional regulator n=1 Tax=Marinivivus vitaminiproducens TaxID=3035935 RepID=UPI0027AB4FEF|nr:IclR family transcriptional regulator [Geminicoccaceae bacterium SCSIO 64248]